MHEKITQIRKSKRSWPEYVERVMRHWYFALPGLLFVALSPIQLLLPTFTLPWWALLVLAFLFLGLAQFIAFDEVAVARDQALNEIAQQRRLDGLVEIEARRSQKWGSASFYLQHIHVTNNGEVGTFMATVTTNFVGLEADWGVGYEIPWEHPHAAEKRLGTGQLGTLHFLGCEPDDEGRIEVFAFAVPEPRHHGSTGYLPTSRYRLAAGKEEVTFTLCVRNIDTDVRHIRECQMTFADDGKPRLTIGRPE